MSDLVERVARAITRTFWTRTYDQETGTIGILTAEHWQINKDLARAAIAAHESALAEAGYVIVPREPTGEMIAAGNASGIKASVRTVTSDVWRAMVEAAVGGCCPSSRLLQPKMTRIGQHSQFPDFDITVRAIARRISGLPTAHEKDRK